MCLSRIDGEETARFRKAGKEVAYKIGRVIPASGGLPRRLAPPFYGLALEFGKWIKDKKTKRLPLPAYPPRNQPGDSYKTGFHLYANYRDAVSVTFPEESVVRCEFDAVVAVGWWGDKKVIVARKLKLGKVLKTS